MLKINRKIILASQSPRRKQLLREAGFEFEVQAMDIDESFPDDMPVHDVAPYLATLKAKACRAANTDSDCVIIASDSVVILEDVIYGKPTSYDDAFDILRKLSGKKHDVVTGVCISDQNKEVTFASTAYVYFAPLSDEEIHYYITHYKPYDKAGAYAIQEWIGLCKIDKIEGTFSNIMGLPMPLVYKHLEAFLYQKI